MVKSKGDKKDNLGCDALDTCAASSTREGTGSSPPLSGAGSTRWEYDGNIWKVETLRRRNRDKVIRDKQNNPAYPAAAPSISKTTLRENADRSQRAFRRRSRKRNSLAGGQLRLGQRLRHRLRLEFGLEILHGRERVLSCTAAAECAEHGRVLGVCDTSGGAGCVDAGTWGHGRGVGQERHEALESVYANADTLRRLLALVHRSLGSYCLHVFYHYTLRQDGHPIT